MSDHAAQTQSKCKLKSWLFFYHEMHIVRAILSMSINYLKEYHNDIITAA